MAYNKYELLLHKSIKNLIKYCDDGNNISLKILSESDLKCFLFSELIKYNYIKETSISKTWSCSTLNSEKKKSISKEKARFPSIITECLYSKEFIKGKKIKSKNQFCDLVIVEPNEVSIFYKKDTKNKSELFEYQLSDISEESIFVELKWAWKKTENKIIKEFNNDINKFQDDIKRRYVIYFDQSGSLTKSGFNSIKKDGRTKLIYYDNKNKKILTSRVSLI